MCIGCIYEQDRKLRRRRIRVGRDAGSALFALGLGLLYDLSLAKMNTST